MVASMRENIRPNRFSCPMTALAPPTLDPIAAERWRNLPQTLAPWLHEEVAQRMLARLDYIKTVPGVWLDWGPVRGGLGINRQLQQRFSSAKVWVREANADAARQSALALTPPFWSAARWRRGRVQAYVDGGVNVDMIWSNMALHMDEAPGQTMARWQESLKTGGFLMFSCLGPDTLRELRLAYRDLNWPEPSHAYTDMHDLGDMLVKAGFAEPVMSMERLTLTYSSAEALLAELRTLGRNLSVGRFGALRARSWRKRWLQEMSQRLADPANGGRLGLSFEVVYGHAFKAGASPDPQAQAQTAVSLDEVRLALVNARKRSGEEPAADARQ